MHDEIRDRGLLYLKLERFSEAVDDLETYLRLAPDAADTDEIREQVVVLKERSRATPLRRGRSNSSRRNISPALVDVVSEPR